MRILERRALALICVAGVVVLGRGIGHFVPVTAEGAQAQKGSEGVPVFEADASWPKPLPNHWVYGTLLGIGVDSRDHVFFLHGPFGLEGELLAKMAATDGQGPAPPVLEFDGAGTVVGAWGGPALGYSWPQGKLLKLYPIGSGPGEHGLFVDAQDNVWIAGNGHVVLKFTRAGKFLLQLGELWKTGGSNDPKLDPKTNEVYIADGYVNHRIIVFDATTGAYKRHWGGYGKRPEDGPNELYDPNAGAPPQKLFPVHCVEVAKDGLVYVCDRQRNRIQVFKTDGTFVTEVFVAKETFAKEPPHPYGSLGSAALSADADQRYLYVGDGRNSKIWILRRRDLHVLGSFEARGTHYITVDSKGNIYTTGSDSPRRYLFKGVSESPTR